ncbi:Putative RNA-binding protein EIF1AD [Heterocephalus glaber]|uniref:Putative RNA-binding protein EIF1AD n=1 Tax=Heterocephalus glaber TaxID=10181 RepID=G5BFD4_HETGA|nr:Putative RNA-binding protein EIF1AD [Heterocephalus glaber]
MPTQPAADRQVCAHTTKVPSHAEDAKSPCCRQAATWFDATKTQRTPDHQTKHPVAGPSMSQATKRKHVVKEVLGEHMVPSDRPPILRKAGFWPEAFSAVAEKGNSNRNRYTQPELPAEPQSSGEESGSADDSEPFVNTSHREYYESEEESEEEEALET